MDFDLFLTSPRWEILQIIAEKPSSPIEIAEKINTTVSYVSQQLKLLDAAGILKKKKTGASEKGKPRTLFGLSKDIMYLTILLNGFSDKKLISVDKFKEIILRIWAVSDSSQHYILQKFFWKIEEAFDCIESIYYGGGSRLPKIVVLLKEGKNSSKLLSLAKKFDKEVDFESVKLDKFSKMNSESLSVIYDPSKILEKLKGGSLN